MNQTRGLSRTLATLGLSAMALFASCASDGGERPEGVGGAGAVPPEVVSKTPDSGETGVSLDSDIVVTFSEKMDASTIDTGSFQVSSADAGSVSGSVSVSGGKKKATFSPDGGLIGGVTYDVTLTTTIQNAEGVALGGAETWSFTTGNE